MVLYGLSFFWTDAAIKSIQFLQLALLHATLNINIPPILAYYLYELRKAILSFLPNFFKGQILPNKVYHHAPQKIIDLFVDYDFLRNMGQIFFFIIMFSGMWMVFLFLSSKKLISNKLWFNMFEDIFKRRFKFMALNDILSLFIVPILWFGLWQFKDLTGTELESGYSTINAVFTVVFLIFAFIIPVIWGLFWFKFDGIRF